MGSVAGGVEGQSSLVGWGVPEAAQPQPGLGRWVPRTGVGLPRPRPGVQGKSGITFHFVTSSLFSSGLGLPGRECGPLSSPQTLGGPGLPAALPPGQAQPSLLCACSSLSCPHRLPLPRMVGDNLQRGVDTGLEVPTWAYVELANQPGNSVSSSAQRGPECSSCCHCCSCFRYLMVPPSQAVGCIMCHPCHTPFK